MKRQDVLTFVAYAFMLAIALVVGIVVIYQNGILQDLKSSGEQIGVTIASLTVAFILHTIIFELAHIVGAKIGGYDVTRVNFFFFNFEKNNENKFKFSLKSFDGLVGETCITPKEGVIKEPNPKPFLWFGAIFYAIQLIGGITFLVLNPGLATDSTLIIILRAYVIFHITLGGMLLLYAIFPAKLDTKNDGYYIAICNGATNVKAFNLMLTVEETVRRGLPAPKMESFQDITEFTAKINILIAADNVIDNRFEDAISAIAPVLIDEKEVVSSRTKLAATAEKISALIFLGSLEEATSVYNELPIERKKILTNDKSLAGLRINLIITAIIEDSFAESLISYREFRKKTVKSQELLLGSDGVLFQKGMNLIAKLKPNFDYEGSNTLPNNK